MEQQEKPVAATISKPINPIFAYLSFVRRTVLTKKSLIICFSVFSAIAIFLGIMPAILWRSDASELRYWSSHVSGMLIAQCSVFAFSAAIVGVLVFLTMFKDGESDGTELITVSKPITRFQILISRFIFALVLSIAIALINVIFAAIDYGITNSVSHDCLEYILYPPIGSQSGPGYFGGIFGGTILAFFTFGLIASSISNVAGGKATRIVTLLIMFLSFIIVSIGSSMIPSLVQNPVVANVNKTAKNALNSFEGKTMAQINNDAAQINSGHAINIFTSRLPSAEYQLDNMRVEEVLFKEYKRYDDETKYGSYYYSKEYSDMYSLRDSYAYDSNSNMIYSNFDDVYLNLRMINSPSISGTPATPNVIPDSPSSSYINAINSVTVALDSDRGNNYSEVYLNPNDNSITIPEDAGLIGFKADISPKYGLSGTTLKYEWIMNDGTNNGVDNGVVVDSEVYYTQNDEYQFYPGLDDNNRTLKVRVTQTEDSTGRIIAQEESKPIKLRIVTKFSKWLGIDGQINDKNHYKDFRVGYGFDKYVALLTGKTPASGATALSYLNPASAMVGMMTQNLSSTSGFGPSIPYNWSVTKLELPKYRFTDLPNMDIPSSPSSEYRGRIVIADHSVADPNWGLMLVYIAICGILGALTTVGYLRKDFK